MDNSRSLEGAHDSGLASEQVLQHPRAVSQPQSHTTKWSEREAVTFSPRMSWTPLSTSARERYPFPLGSNCRKSSSRSAFSESLFPIGSFAAHTLQDIRNVVSSESRHWHETRQDTVQVSCDLKSLLLPAVAPLRRCCAPAGLPADPGVDRRGTGWLGVRKRDGGSGLAP